MKLEKEEDKDLFYEEGDQISIPPQRTGALWKVVINSVRCPVCHSTDGKKLTGKRINRDGLQEYYRCCLNCDLRFRVVLE